MTVYARYSALPHASNLVPRTSNLALLAVGFLHLVPRTSNLALLAVGFLFYHQQHVSLVPRYQCPSQPIP
jgi:hypothetical protein